MGASHGTKIAHGPESTLDRSSNRALVRRGSSADAAFLSLVDYHGLQKLRRVRQGLDAAWEATPNKREFE